MNNKKIALYEREFIGGEPKVERYENSDETASIDILSANNGYLKDRVIYATIGLHKTDIGLTVKGVPLRTELIMACRSENEVNKNLIASAAFEIMTNKSAGRGEVIENIIHSYIKNTEMKHLLCMTPVFWQNYKVLREEEEIVAWLQLIPVSDAELNYINENGLDAFDSLLEKTKTDITRLKRKSIV